MRTAPFRPSWSTVPLLFLALAVGGCSCGEPVGTPDTGAHDTGPTCLATAAACTTGVEPLCCSGLCVGHDGGVSTCSEEQLCGQENETCTSATQCCSLNCSGGKCLGSSCATIDSPCAAPGDCCSGVCTAGKCATIPNSTCKNLGESCTGSGGLNPDGGVVAGSCCSDNCQGGRCVRASACSTAGDICYAALDCCNGTCNIATTGGPGTCAGDLTVPGATGCTIGGEVCGDSTGCCGHLCLDLGSGVSTCVLGSGCRERGEICQETVECCGNDTSGVVCQKAAAGDLVGRCANPQACQPIGNCCGAFGSNCRQACCNGQKEVCKLDQQGLSRCFGGCPNDVCPANCPDGYDGNDPNCCIATGAECQFRDQCCNLVPCLQDPATGKYACKAPTCVAAGDNCTPGTSVCCNGLDCGPNGEIGFVCRVPGTLTDAGIPIPRDDAGNPLPNDGGTVGPGYDAGPTCKSNLALCSSGAECCSNTCIGGVCMGCKPDGQSCAAGTDCCTGLCSGGKCVPPTTCVSQGGACSGTAECCPGTVCDISAGQATGTCNPGSTCSSAGQACSATQACCTTLRCDNSTTSDPCAATDIKCVCHVVIN